MLKLKLQLKNLAPVAALCMVVLLAFGHVAWGVVRYPSVASLGTGDIKTNHIADGTIQNVDISDTAWISSDKITFSTSTANASTTWARVMDSIAGVATTSGMFLYSNGVDWAGCSGEACRYLLGAGTLSTQNSTSVAITGGDIEITNGTSTNFETSNVKITGGTITGITDLGLADGGTGQSWNNATQGGIPYISATGTAAILTAGTADYVLATQGAFADPYWKLLQTLTYVEVQPTAWTDPASDNVWGDWDLSGSIPTTAKYCEITWYCTTNAACVWGVRKDGGSTTRTITTVGTSSTREGNMTVDCSVNRTVELFSNDRGTSGFSLVGYWY